MRSLFRWFFFLFALAALGGLAMLARRSLDQTPRAAFQAGSRAAFGPDRDAGLAFRHLNFALRGAEAEQDTELLVDVLKTRGRLYQTLGSLPRARQDYEEVLRRYRADDLESELALATILLALNEDGEASKRIESVLERNPDHGRALSIRAELQLRYSRSAMVEANRLVSLALPPAERNRAMALLAKASNLPLEEPRRLRLLEQLRDLFPRSEEHLLQSVLATLEAATARNASARAALVASFASAASTSTMVSYLDILSRSGRTPLAIEFALGAAHHRGATADPGFLDRCANLLTDNGQPHLAVEAIARHLGGNVPSPNFYQRWCRLLYGEKRWNDLIIVASAFGAAGNAEQRLQAFAYVGLAHAELEHWDEAQKLLRPFLSKDPPEPFPGAIDRCWQQLARCYREEDRPTEEAGALRMALSRGRGRLPDEAQLWLRLYELGESDTTPTKSPVELERILTFAISLSPERLDELMPTWHELGRRNLDAARINLSAVFDDMVQTQSYAPPTAAGPYEMFELAQLFYARGIHPGVLQCCGRLLSSYPGFLPAEDLMIDSRDALGDKAGLARVLMARLTRNPTPALVARIAALGPGVIDPRQRLQLMRSDPRGYARRKMLDGLASSGDTGEMVNALLSLPDDEISGSDRVYAGRLLLALDHGSELGVVLDDLEPDPELQASASGLRLRAALASGDLEAFDNQLELTLAGPQVDGQALSLVLDDLLAQGHSRRALALGQWLDEQPAWRSGSNVLRTSQAARRLGALLDSAEGLVRADAVLGDGAPELGYLIDAVADRDWGRLPERVVDLRTSGFAPSDLAAVLLDILGEEHQSAAARLIDASARAPKEPLWALCRAALSDLMGLELNSLNLPGWSPECDHQTRLALRGPQGSDRDPREILVVLLAAEHPQWRDWALAECEEHQDPDSGSMWYGYAAGRSWLRRGDSARAADHAEILVSGWPEFQAAWDLLEQADRATQQRLQGRTSATPPDQLSWVRWRQREVLGAMPGDPALEFWMSALMAESLGNPDLALNAVARAIELSPADVRFRLTQSRLYAIQLDWAPALTAMDRAIDTAGATSRQWVAERALELHQEILRDPPSASLLELVNAQREHLQQSFPTDPLVAIELARGDVASYTTTPDRGLAKAVRRLERLRKLTDKRPLELLRPGSTRMWFEFLLEFDGNLAKAYALEELQARPAFADLWRMLAESTEASEQWGEAIELRRFLQASLPNSVDARALVRLLARSGRDAEEFERAFAGCLVQEDLLEPDIDLQIERARFLLESGEQGWLQSRLLLDALWNEHSVAAIPETGDVDPLDGGSVPGNAPPPDGGVGSPIGQEDRSWEAPADEAETELTYRIGRVYLRLLAWSGSPEDAELLDEVSRAVEAASWDPLEREVLQALRALAPRPVPGEF